MSREKFNLRDIESEGKRVLDRYGIQGAQNHYKALKKHVREMDGKQYEKFFKELYGEKK